MATDAFAGAFKAYDIRGRVPDQLNGSVVARIGAALSSQLRSGPVVVGRDVRLSSHDLQEALTRGLLSVGRDVIDIGLCGTEEVYFQTDHLDAAGGVMVTASHNPRGDNGIKVYDDRGIQIVAPWDSAIAARLDQAPPADRIPLRPGKVDRVPDSVIEA